MSKIKQSNRIIATILGPNVVSSFEITSRRTLAGSSTFSLVYVNHGRVPLITDVPLRKIREALERIRRTNSLAGFASHLVEDLTAERRFDPRLLNGHGWTWCSICSGLLSGRVIVEDDNYIVQATPSESPYRGPITHLCSCRPRAELDITEVLPLYGIVIGRVWPCSGASVLVRWMDDHWAAGIVRLPPTQAVRELGRFRSYDEAQTAAARGPYHYRSRGSLSADWKLGPMLIPSHAAQPGDIELGEFDDRNRAWVAAKNTARYRPATPEEAIEAVRHIATSGDSNLPHGLLARLAGLLDGRAAQYDLSVLRGEVGKTLYYNWVFNLGSGELFFAEEHFYPAAGTCCTSLTRTDWYEAFGLLDRHSYPMDLDEVAIGNFLSQE